MRFVWIVRDSFIGHAMLDATAAAFLLPSILSGAADSNDVPHSKNAPQEPPCECDPVTPSSTERVSKSWAATSPKPAASSSTSNSESSPDNLSVIGPSLGPNWYDHFTTSLSAAYPDAHAGSARAAQSLQGLKRKIGGCPCCAGPRGAFFVPEEFLNSENSGNSGDAVQERGPGKRTTTTDATNSSFVILHDTQIESISHDDETGDFSLELCTKSKANSNSNANSNANSNSKANSSTANVTKMSFGSLICATGVSPLANLKKVLCDKSPLALSDESGAVKVNKRMQSISHEVSMIAHRRAESF